MCHMITSQVWDRHFLEAAEKSTGIVWLAGYKRFVIGACGLRFLCSDAAPIVAETDMGLEISCRSAVTEQPLELALPTTAGTTKTVYLDIKGGMHVAPIETLTRLGGRRSYDCVDTIAFFKAEDIVFFDGVDVSIRQMLIPKDCKMWFSLIQNIEMRGELFSAIADTLEKQYDRVSDIIKTD